jgi:hypothetical protein
MSQGTKTKWSISEFSRNDFGLAFEGDGEGLKEEASRSAAASK